MWALGLKEELEATCIVSDWVSQVEEEINKQQTLRKLRSYKCERKLYCYSWGAIVIHEWEQKTFHCVLCEPNFRKVTDVYTRTPAKEMYGHVCTMTRDCIPRPLPTWNTACTYGKVVRFALSRIGPTVKQWEETHKFGFQNPFK